MNMKEILEELKEELLSKKMSLLEMDNAILDLLKQNEIESESLFNNEYYCMQNLSCSYNTTEDNGIYIAFKIIKKDEENNLYTEIEITEIGEF